MKKRCKWSSSVMMNEYHDQEWGVPVYDDKKLFEFLILEGMQAGLSWNTILAKRENFRAAFSNFNVVKISKYTKKDSTRLLKDAGIIRNNLKIAAAVNNAKQFLKVRTEFGTFSRYIWKFVGGKPIKNKFTKLSQIPVTSKISSELSADLKKRGFKFVGSTIMYSHMQATGMVNDHLTYCFRYEQV